ncbi:MAG: THUMP domain-containing protein [Leptospiraceae bacterium]
MKDRNPKQKLSLKATTLRGLEEVLMEELKNLGASNLDRQHGAVLFSGDFELLYRCCIRLRSAVRVLMILSTTRIADQQDLYDLGRSISWNDWFSVSNSIAVDAAVHSRIFSNSHYAALKLKDAVCDEFRSGQGKRPDVSIREADIRIHLHIHEQDCTISLDGAGGSLHRRGYRAQSDLAPISEVLAAGMVQLASPNWENPFLDFMCGSGTIPMEAYMIRKNLAPGVFRKKMAFENWKTYFEKSHRSILAQEKGQWTEAQKSRADSATEQTDTALIRGSDRSAKAIEIAKSNRKILGLGSQDIFFETRKAETIQDLSESGTAIINPPYGERLSLEDAAAFYKDLGDIMKASFKGWTVWVLSANLEAFKRIGLKPSKKVTLFNGPLECSFRRFDMY